jgi:hypothetical protein
VVLAVVVEVVVLVVEVRLESQVED